MLLPIASKSEVSLNYDEIHTHEYFKGCLDSLKSKMNILIELYLF